MPAQVMNGVGQLVHVQRPASQVPPSQMRPHAPQFVASMSVSTHAPSQMLVPVGQRHVPDVHEAPPGQTVPQPPQFAASLDVSMQRVPQSVSPPGHVHDPPTHSVSTEHELPQAPQFAASVAVSVQAPKNPPQSVRPPPHVHMAPAASRHERYAEQLDVAQPPIADATAARFEHASASSWPSTRR